MMTDDNEVEWTVSYGGGVFLLCTLLYQCFVSRTKSNQWRMDHTTYSLKLK